MRTNQLKFTLTLITFFTIFLWTGCVKDHVDVKNISTRIFWNPQLGTPIAYSDLSIEDIIATQDSIHNIQEDSTHFMTLIYSHQILSKSAEELLPIPNQSFNEVLLESDYSLPPMPVVDTIALDRSDSYNFAFSNGELIDNIKLKTGTMIFNISSTYKHEGYIEITVPQLIKNGNPLTFNVDINKSDGTFSDSKNFDLSGYNLQLTHPHTTDNLMAYQYKARLVNSGKGISIGDNITVGISFNDIKFSSMDGYLGQLPLLDYQSNLELSLFKNASNLNLEMADPRLKLLISNSFGLPAKFEMYNVKTVSDKDNVTVPVGFTPAVNPFTVEAPAVLGQTKHDSVTFDALTSNLKEAMAITPKYFYYGIRASANPGGKVSNYVTDTSKINVDMQVELPIYLRTALLEFTDTLNMDLGSISGITDSIKTLLIHTSFENGMPFELRLQVFLMDQNYHMVDSLFTINDQPIIGSGLVNGQGKVTETVKKATDVTFTNARISALKNVRYGLVKAGVITANDGKDFVKFYSDYRLKVHINIQTQFEISQN